MATLSLEQVTKVFGNGVEAVRQLDLFVDEGEFVVLVGPSGCGKTTALRMVAGLEAVTSGTIRLDGKVINDLTAKDRDVAMVFQNYALYPHMNVLDNIAFSLRVRGVAKQERHRKARETADVLGLSEVVLRKPRQLSGGQRQRVAMGRALVREPAVFLMDEPLSNLDANLRVQMRSEVLRVQRRLGVATLYVTHDQTEAMTMGDRVAVLRGGALQQLAAPQELYEQPANLFVASFIGSPAMNLYEATVSGPADRLVLSLGSQQLALPADLVRRRPGLAATERKLVVGIRPEHLTVAPRGRRRGCSREHALRAGRARRGARQRVAPPLLDRREESAQPRRRLHGRRGRSHCRGDRRRVGDRKRRARGSARPDRRRRSGHARGRCRSPPLLRRRVRRRDPSSRRLARRAAAGGPELRGGGKERSSKSEMVAGTSPIELEGPRRRLDLRANTSRVSAWPTSCGVAKDADRERAAPRARRGGRAKLLA